jgi:hypothetical protein
LEKEKERKDGREEMMDRSIVEGRERERERVRGCFGHTPSQRDER